MKSYCKNCEYFDGIGRCFKHSLNTPAWPCDDAPRNQVCPEFCQLALLPMRWALPLAAALVGLVLIGKCLI